MPSFIQFIFDTKPYMPHGMCYLWQERLLWLHVISDVAIAIAYFSIPLALAFFVHQKKQLEYKWVFILFTLFILACGTTHILSVITIWNPIYWLSGFVKMITAGLSITTALLLWPLIPKAVQLPSPSHLLVLNDKLECEIEIHKRTKFELQQLNETLDKQVDMRTKELQQLNQKLQDSEDKYKNLLSAAGEGIYGLDLGGKAIFANPACCKMLGYNEDELIGQPIQTLIQYTYADDNIVAIKDLDQQTELTHGDVVKANNEIFLRKDSSFFPVDFVSTPLKNKGKIAGSVVVFSDITDQKNNETLLINSKNAAEKANKAKSEFLSRMSHELRTPMNAVLGFSQLLDSDDITEDQHENVHEIVKAGEHLLELINEVLELSKIESGKFDLHSENIELNEIIQDSIVLTTPMAQKHSIEIIDLITQTSQFTIYGDKTRLKQVMLNLLSNAIKYNREKGNVTLTYEQPSVNSKKLRLNIIDTGYGMTEEQINKLFQPFERLSAEFSEIEGTGIGLVITKALIEQMGGAIGVTSSKEGSCFWIEFKQA